MRNLILLFSLMIFTSLPAHAENSVQLNNQGVEQAKAGNFQQAVMLLKKSLSLNPDDNNTRKNLSSILTEWSSRLYQEGRTTETRKRLQEALALAPDNAGAWFLLGDIYYLIESDFANAIAAWKKALPGAPKDKRKAVTDRIIRAELDQNLEKRHQSKRTAHFLIRHEPTIPDRQLEEIGRMLEQEYANLSQLLGVQIPTMSVIVYPSGSFQRLTHRFEWSAGFYDGRIRIREEDLGTPWQQSILAHELAHAFLHHGFGFSIPTWVHEGFAQFNEPPRQYSPEEEFVLEGLRERTLWIPLKWLDRRFVQPVDIDDVTRAYLESKLIVEHLIRKRGMDRFRRFLDQLSSGKAVREAFDSSFAPSKWSRVTVGNLE